MPTARTVITPRRLYDVYPDTGIRFLAYAAGDEVPAEEYRRLVGGGVLAASATVASWEPEPEFDTPDLKAMTKAQLLVLAKQHGVSISTRERAEDIRIAVRAALEGS
jgi:hypothetical protein